MGTSTINQWSYPDFDDAPDIRDVRTLADQIDTLLLPSMTYAQSTVTYPGGPTGALLYMTDQRVLARSFAGQWRSAAHTDCHSAAVDYRSADATNWIDVEDMKFPVLSGASYVFEGVFLYRMNATNALLIRWQAPNSSRSGWSESENQTVNTLSGSLTFNASTGTLNMVHFSGFLIGATAAGDLYPQIRKNSNTAPATDSELIMKSGSWCRLMRVG